MKAKKQSLPIIKELSENIVFNWLCNGAIKPIYEGSENTYYIDDFNNEFYCKNYPNQEGV
jgi:hypothetical protein